MEFRIPTQDLIKEMFKSGYKKKAKELGKEYLNSKQSSQRQKWRDIYF